MCSTRDTKVPYRVLTILTNKQDQTSWPPIPDCLCFIHSSFTHNIGRRFRSLKVDPNIISHSTVPRRYTRRKTATWAFIGAAQMVAFLVVSTALEIVRQLIILHKASIRSVYTTARQFWICYVFTAGFLLKTCCHRLSTTHVQAVSIRSPKPNIYVLSSNIVSVMLKLPTQRISTPSTSQ